MPQPVLLTASQLALMVSLLFQRYGAERGKDLSRFRLARNSLRRLAIRARLRDALVDEWIDIMALEHGWLVFADADEFLLLKRESAASWTKIATKRCDDLIKRLRTGDLTAIDDAESELETSPELDDGEE